MSLRIRHCVECPECHTFYVIAASPYRNGSYLVRTLAGSGEQYDLYCRCQGADVPRRSRWREAQPCEISKAAHAQGYGALGDICPSPPPQPQTWFDLNKYLNPRQE